MEAKIAALKGRTEKPIPNNNAYGGNRQVHFNHNVNDFAEAVAEQDEDDENDV